MPKKIITLILTGLIMSAGTAFAATNTQHPAGTSIQTTVSQAVSQTNKTPQTKWLTGFIRNNR